MSGAHTILHAAFKRYGSRLVGFLNQSGLFGRYAETGFTGFHHYA